MLLNAYAQGYFPMAQSEDDPELMWFNPDPRALIPLDGGFHISRTNKKLFRQHEYRLTLNRDFRGVMEQCRRDRDGCWISNRIIDYYSELQTRGFAQSLECWQGEQLVGGIYGVTLGAAFFGESMFSRVSGASTIALMAMVKALRAAGYTLFDVQYVNDHIEQFGIIEISREHYLERLDVALDVAPKELNISIG